jgi:hypothetical protein
MKQFILCTILFAIHVSANSQNARFWGTYFGGSSDDGASGIARDDSGNIYITGTTGSMLGIATPGAFQPTYGGNQSDAFLAKFSRNGTLLWTTYYGGTGIDVANSVATDSAGNVYIAGNTYSDSGIATPGAFDTVNSADQGTGFLVKFNGSGSQLWATYYGGAGYQDAVAAVTIDGAGNVYIAGSSYSSAGIASSGAYDTIYGGQGDGFLAKFSSNGGRLWATYFGGNSQDVASGVITDASGNVYITGITTSTAGIATSGAYDTTFSGYSDAFIAKFDGTGALNWATYYGDSGNTTANSIANDNTGAIYITGGTNSVSGIATPGAYDTTFGGDNDAFLAKFDTGGKLRWSTYYGNNKYTYGYGLAPDGSGYIYVTGATTSAGGIVATGAYQTNCDTTSGSAFLAQFDGSGVLLYGSYYGSNLTVGYGVVYAGDGDVYVAGGTVADTSIATDGAYQTVFGGGGDAGEDESGDAFLVMFGPTTLPGINKAPVIANNIVVFPNPSTGQLYFKGINAGSVLEIYNVMGENVYSAEVSSDTFMLNLAGKASGIYFYRITDNNNGIQEGKIILE